MATTRYIHNISGAEKTYRGVPIADGAFYQIELANLSWYQSSDDVLADLAADAIRMSADGVTDYSTSTADNIAFLMGSEPALKDSDGATISRTKLTTSGWHYHMYGFEFRIGTLNSVVDSGGFVTIKYYDDDDVELTTQLQIDTDCVKTVVEWTPTYDYDIIGGQVWNRSTLSSDCHMDVKAAPGLADTEFIKNINLRYIQNSSISTDGRTPKRMTYISGLKANTFQFTFSHNVGLDHNIQIAMELFKSP